MKRKLTHRITTDFNNSEAYVSATEKDLKIHIKEMARHYNKQPSNFKIQKL